MQETIELLAREIFAVVRINAYNINYMPIPLAERVGFVDRKIARINREVTDKAEWQRLVQLAYKSSYGFEWNGDSLLLARENLLYSKLLISPYATTAVNLYGVISVDEFVEGFNHHEKTHTTSKEALLALIRLAKTDDVDYSVSGEIISAPEFQPDFDDYKENVDSIRNAQKGKHRYLPCKEEFLKYVDGAYRESEKPYTDLKAYILKYKLTVRGEGIDGVDGDLIDLHEMIQFGVSSADEIGYFTEAGYKFKDMDEANSFSQLVMNAHNHTRMYDNNGFTPNEIFERFERPNLKPLPKKPFTFKAAPKVGRNAPCPYGSGLKYKKCVGNRGVYFINLLYLRQLYRPLLCK